MHNRILVIDGQVFQSEAWDRGMGKYSLNLIKYLSLNGRYQYDETYIVFSKNLPLSHEVKREIKKAVPNAITLLVNIPTPNDSKGSRITDIQISAKNILTKYLKEKVTSDLQNIDYIILSLFIDGACSVFPETARNILLFYDLIPIQYYERYGKLTSFDNYLARFKTLFEADLILTISQAVADDLSVYLGLPGEITHNIKGAAIERKSKPTKPKLDVSKRYVLMPSGNELRKNNIIGVQSFEEYVRVYNDTDIQLVITSHFDEATIDNLRGYSSNILFSGNVSEAEIAWLYANSEAVLFVSEYEGLGLPILEGVEANKPIICSNLAVFREMSDKSFYFADEKDTVSISEALQKAINHIGFSKKRKEYKTILKNYSWEETADKTIDAIESLKYKSPTPKKKVAVFTPDPSRYSAIGSHVMHLHHAMSQYFDIDYYIETGITEDNFKKPSYLPYLANTYMAKDFKVRSHKKYDAVLYNIGNSEFHIETIKKALLLPGYVVMHDLHLKNVFTGLLTDLGILSRERVKAEDLLNKKSQSKSSSYIASLVNRQKGVIVHSEYAKKAVEAILVDETPVQKNNLPTLGPQQTHYNLKNQPIVIGLAGIIHPVKGLDIVEAIAKMDNFSKCEIHIFGYSLTPPEILQQLDSYPNVIIDTDVTDFQFQTMLSKVDILLSYRSDYRGETSAATLEAMRFGAIPFVRDIGWFSELPDDCVVKAKSKEELMDELSMLISDKTKLFEMKTKARNYIQKNFSYQQYAERLNDLIK